MATFGVLHFLHGLMPEIANHPGQTLDSGCKPRKHAQRVNRHHAGHALTVSDHVSELFMSKG